LVITQTTELPLANKVFVLQATSLSSYVKSSFSSLSAAPIINQSNINNLPT